MQTPQKNAPQSARRSSKQQRPKTEGQQSAQSDNDAYLVAPQEGDQTPSTKKRQPRKKSNARKNGVQSDVGEMADNQGSRHFSHSERVRQTPAKAVKSDAYAGPTFHQSPAASALPMPSFLSRSVPSSAAISTISETADGSSDAKQEAAKEMEKQRETTPRDWMFDAARQAKGTPNGASPARMLSPRNGTPVASPAARREEADFPFELDGEDEPDPVYTTPLSHRFAASRSPPANPEGGQLLTEEERKAKTAALKKALLKSAANPETPAPAFNDGNPFNAKNVTPTPPRHTSNPSTPTYMNGYNSNQNNHYFQQYAPQSPSRNFTTQPVNRPQSSGLRNVYDPTRAPPMSPPATISEQRISTARSPPPAKPLNFESIYGQTSRPSSEGNIYGHNSKPSLEQGLDDLKKALNMDFLGRA